LICFGKENEIKNKQIYYQGRITIPAKLRKNFSLTPGRRVKFEVTENGIRIIPLATQEEIKANAGLLGMKGKLLKALIKEKKREREL
jgi:AbrB family looped-hinge helix DNA binding protein